MLPTSVQRPGLLMPLLYPLGILLILNLILLLTMLHQGFIGYGLAPRNIPDMAVPPRLQSQLFILFP